MLRKRETDNVNSSDRRMSGEGLLVLLHIKNHQKSETSRNKSEKACNETENGTRKSMSAQKLRNDDPRLRTRKTKNAYTKKPRTVARVHPSVDETNISVQAPRSRPPLSATSSLIMHRQSFEHSWYPHLRPIASCDISTPLAPPPISPV